MHWPRLKLRWQLLISYLPVMLIPIIVTGIVVNNVAAHGLTVLVTQEAQQRAITVSGVFTNYYIEHGSWAGADSLFKALQSNIPDNPPPNPPQSFNGRQPDPLRNNNGRQIGELNPNNPLPGQILIADPKGIVVASGRNSANGQVLSAAVLAQGAPLTVNNKLIGTLVIGAASGMPNPQEKQLLDTVSSSLLLTGLVTTVLVIILGLWLSGQLTAPVRDLIAGVKQLASGHWSEPVVIRSQNEFADLTLAFNGMAEQLTRQQQQQRQMIADIAHDLRTPLSVMALEVAGIRAGLQSPEEATGSLEEEIEWLQHLIEDLHTLSLMDTGRFALHLDDTALTPYLNSLCTQWQPMATQDGKILTCNISVDLPVVKIDGFRIRQVIGNLLNNALQHTPPDTQIDVRAVATSTQVEIIVADNGPGIAPEDLDHIFERFYRADRARNRSGHEHGSGLGLSIAYQLVELHHGKLSVDSTIGIGTTFHVRLPRS